MSVSAIESKKVVVSEIAEKFKNAQSAIVVEYRGLSVDEVTLLRRNLRKEGVEFKVYKNTMTERAVESLGYSEIVNDLKGPNAIAFGVEDAVAPAKILADFAKKHKALVIKSGIVEGNFVEAKGVAELAKLPNRDGMYSMLLSCLQSPIRSFACAVKAVADKQEN